MTDPASCPNRLTTKRLSPDLVPPWDELPDTIILHIFSYLDYRDISVAACTCTAWQRVAYDEFLWKYVFHAHFSVPKNLGLAPGRTSWREEFIRLYSEAPTVHLETIKSHTDQVLHVSFSHNGRMFATSSKDGFIKVWNAGYPVTLRHSKDMRDFSWKYTQYSQFNETDTLLLVSGVYFGTQSTSGEIAIFSLLGSGSMGFQCRVLNKPYDVFGTWYNDRYLLSGNLAWIDIMGPNICSCSIITLNYAFQNTESEEHSVMRRLFRFKNINSSTIRTLVIAQPQRTLQCATPTVNSAHNAISTSANSSQSVLEQSFELQDDSLPLDWKENSNACEKPVKTGEKLLIFTKGDKTYTPHKIGIKRLPEYAWAEDGGVKEIPGLPTEDYRLLADSEFDHVDYCIDMDGHVIGMGLSPDHRYLYMNVRAWPEKAEITDALRPPPIAQEIDIRVIDLLNLTRTDQVFRSHRAFTPDDDCFFIFLDVSPDYLASGAEDKHGYVWDRHYGCLLAKFPHDDVVNSVTFNPREQSHLVTVSDDNSIKVWVSRKRRKQLGLLEHLHRPVPDCDVEMKEM